MPDTGPVARGSAASWYRQLMERRSRVLIIDDEPAGARLLAEALHPEFEVSVLQDAAAALTTARAAPQPDAIVLDLLMPSVDGWEVCRQLKADESTRDIPVIVATTAASEDVEERCFDLGADDFAIKAPSRGILRARVRAQVHHRLQQVALEHIVFPDRVTGLANICQFETSLNLEWERARRSRESVALLLCDVGQPPIIGAAPAMGLAPELLHAVGRVFNASARRATDLAGRYDDGGFALVLPGASLDYCVRVAGHILDRIQHLPGEGTALRLSMGCDSRAAAVGDTYESLVRRVTWQLRRARLGGEDRVCWPGDGDVDEPPHSRTADAVRR